MKLAPFSIAKLMVVVVAVAINLAIVRLLAAYSPVLPVAVAWTGLALQAGGLAVILGRGRARAFSVGFITFGAIALATVIWAMVFATNTGIAYDPSTGKTTTITIPGSPLWTLWSNYFEFVGSFLVEKLQVNIDPEGFLAAVIWASAATHSASRRGNCPSVGRSTAHAYPQGFGRFQTICAANADICEDLTIL